MSEAGFSAAGGAVRRALRRLARGVVNAALSGAAAGVLLLGASRAPGQWGFGLGVCALAVWLWEYTLALVLEAAGLVSSAAGVADRGWRRLRSWSAGRRGPLCPMCSMPAERVGLPG